VVKILIRACKFRLTLQFIEECQVPFQIEFFTYSIESNAYDVSFYLLNIYEEDIML
jgi:hypothetical protein